MYTLRHYQERAVDLLRQSIRKGNKRLILCSPTASGKTVMASHIIDRTVKNGHQVLFLAHRRELVHQCSEKLTENGIRHGIIMAGEKEGKDVYAPVQVASKDTLHARAVRRQVMDMPDAALVVVDEAHRSRAKSFTDLIEHYPDAVVLGLTATPARKDGRGLGDIYTDLVVAASYEELILEGSLVSTRVFAPYVPDLKGVMTSGGDYVEKQLSERMNKQQLVGDIVQTWLEKGEDRQTIVFASGVAHSMHICEEFLKAGVEAEHLDGTTEILVRDESLRRFRTGQYRIITNCAVLTEGWDMPVCSCAVLARPTRSIVLYRQMAGRIQRPDPDSGKTDALILDHSGAVFMHGFPDEDMDWVLEKTQKVSSAKAQQRERGEKVLVRCPNCHFMYEWQPHCPQCGAPAPKKKPRNVRIKKGDLVEIQRRRREQSTQEEKQYWWNKHCFGPAMGKNLKIGAAAHMYKQRYGVWPNSDLIGLPRGKEEWNMRARDFYQLLVRERPEQLPRVRGWT
jgi:DNA repair protein RadD